MSSRNSFAFAFYATDDTYGKAALVVMAALKELGTPEDIDFVLLHRGLSKPLLDRMSGRGLLTREAAPVPRTSNPYYRDCLLKLRVFQLVEYERLLYLDVDALPLARLDHLFHRPLEEAVAMPVAYWLESDLMTSCLMLIKPSPELWERVSTYLNTAAGEDRFDMDILNLEFEGEALRLPEVYVCLDSEWTRRQGPFHFGPPASAMPGLKLLHFSHLGKPWFYRPSWIRHLLPEAHPQLEQVWAQWWRLSDQVFEGRPILAGWKMLLRFLHRFYLYRILSRS